MISAASTHVNQTYTLMKIEHVTNKRFPRILSLRHRIPATSSWISHVNFVSKKKEQKNKNNALFMLKKKKEKQQIKKESCQLVE